MVEVVWILRDSPAGTRVTHGQIGDRSIQGNVGGIKAYKGIEGSNR